MAYRYAFNNYNKELMAKAVGHSLSVSTKQCVEICSHIRGKNIARAKTILNNVIAMKEAIPFKRFNQSVAHKKGIGPGRYPVKACTAVLSIIKTAKSNAQFKGLNKSNMILRHICAHKASTPWHYGRQRGVKMKRTHVEVVLEEVKDAKQDKDPKKSAAAKHDDNKQPIKAKKE